MDTGVEILIVDLPIHNLDLLSDALFDTALNAVDVESQQRVKMFYRREDAWSVSKGQRFAYMSLICSYAPQGVLLGASCP